MDTDSVAVFPKVTMEQLAQLMFDASTKSMLSIRPAISGGKETTPRLERVLLKILSPRKPYTCLATGALRKSGINRIAFVILFAALTYNDTRN